MNNSILYFINGKVPSNEEFEKAFPLMNNGPMVEFISLETFDLNSPLRENVGVAGAVPEPYKHFTIIDKKSRQHKSTTESKDSEK